MKKIFILFILFISQFILGNKVFSAYIPVEKVFLDIDKDYKYYNELQTLYDRGMIFPDENGKFNPLKLLNRDEFVGIAMEVSCKKCISPYTDFSLIKKHYNTKTFYDVSKFNKYFYCIAESDKLGYVKGYNEGSTCQGKEQVKGERPFCIDNKIKLEEALAVILRNSGVFTIEDNKKVIEKIYSGEIKEKLSDDVSPIKADGKVYTFYGYIKKALDFSLKEVDENGNEKIYHLLKKENNKIRPDKNISKEEFLWFSYIALKSNSCIEEEKDNIALNINILNKSCLEGKECNNKVFEKYEDTFDFDLKDGGICEKGIDDENYIWTFYNFDTGKEISEIGKYIDNYTFIDKGKWRITLNIKDNCGNTGNAYSTLFINEENIEDEEIEDEEIEEEILDEDEENVNLGLKVQIFADPIIGNRGLKVDFNGIIDGFSDNHFFHWDFGDGNISELQDPNNVFIEAGIYVVNLIVTDEDGNIGDASVIIKVLDVLDFESCYIDTDKDGIFDCNDKCVLVKGVDGNEGCPVLEDKCGQNCSCQTGYTCTNSDSKVCQNEGFCILEEVNLNDCLQEGFSSFIYGSPICNSCPCSYSLDFNATIRKCDIVFPAITSPDSTKIYGKGKNYQIK